MMTVRELREELQGAFGDDGLRVSVCVRLAEGTWITVEGALNSVSQESWGAPLVLGHLLLPEDVGGKEGEGFKR